jgi:pilus assembly protein CpaE
MASGAPAEVLIAATDPNLRWFAEPLQAEGLTTQVVETYADALRVLEQTPQCVVVLDGEMEATAAFQLYRLLHEAQPRPMLMLVTNVNYPRFALDSRRPALDDYVLKPVGATELALRIKAAMARAGYAVPGTPASEAAPATELATLRHGKIVSVFSTKGGVGKTTVAVNLAVTLARVPERRILLVDADLWFGDASVMLNLATNRGIRDVCEASELDFAALQQALTLHESGISVLARPREASIVDQLDPVAILRAIRGYSALFDYVIVDMRASFDELNLQLLDAADQILLVTTPEVSAIHTTAGFIQMSHSLDYTDKLRLILNRANSGIATNALEDTLGLPVMASIVSAGRMVVNAANQGTPLVLLDPNATERITSDLRFVADLIAGEHPASPLRPPKQPRTSSKLLQQFVSTFHL